MSSSTHLLLKPLAGALGLLFLSGCATLSHDGGLDAVSGMVKQRTGQTVPLEGGASLSPAAAERVRTLLAQPLSAESAVQVALLNNPALKASLADVGVSEADLVQAGRIGNPALSFSRVAGGGAGEIDRGVLFSLAGLLTMPARAGIERRRFEQAQLQAAAQAVALAGATRRAFYQAVAARQGAGFMAQVSASAQASAELAQRMTAAGNWSQLDQAREQVFYADALAQVARARQQVVASDERLVRLLGLWGPQAMLNLPERLPELPAAPRDGAGLEARAMTQRLDLQASKRDTQASASALGLTRATGFINVLDAGYANKSTTGQPRENGYQVSLELPLFDWGTARTAKAQALYMQAVQRTADTAIRARSEVREAYTGYRSAYDVARHYRDEVLPLRKKISGEMLLRYNGMLISVFELLADAREQITSVNTAIDAQRDFWLADTALSAAVDGAGAVPSNEKQDFP